MNVFNQGILSMLFLFLASIDSSVQLSDFSTIFFPFVGSEPPVKIAVEAISAKKSLYIQIQFAANFYLDC